MKGGLRGFSLVDENSRGKVQQAGARYSGLGGYKEGLKLCMHSCRRQQCLGTPGKQRGLLAGVAGGSRGVARGQHRFIKHAPRGRVHCLNVEGGGVDVQARVAVRGLGLQGLG